MTLVALDLDGATLTSGLEEGKQAGTDAATILLTFNWETIDDFSDSSKYTAGDSPDSNLWDWNETPLIQDVGGTLYLNATTDGSAPAYVASKITYKAVKVRCTVRTCATNSGYCRWGIGDAQFTIWNISKHAVRCTSNQKVYGYAGSAGYQLRGCTNADEEMTITWTRDIADSGGEWVCVLDGAGFDEKVLDTSDWSGANTYLGTYEHTAADPLYTKKWEVGAYSDSTETATLVASSVAGTWDFGTFDIPIIVDGSRVATTDTTVLLDYKIDGGAWETDGGSHYTVAEIQALGSQSVGTSIQLRYQITGDGSQSVELYRPMCDVAVPTAGTAPGQASIAATHDSTTSSRLLYDIAAATTGTVSSTRLQYRRVSSTSEFAYLTTSTSSDYLAGLSEGVYELSAVSLNGTVCGDWAPSVFAYVGEDKIKGAMQEIRTKIRNAGIEDLDDRNVLIAGKEYRSGTPAVVIQYRGSSDNYEGDLIEQRHTVDIMVFYSATHTPQADLVSGDNVTTVGLVNIVKQVKAALKGYKPSTCRSILEPKTTAQPRKVPATGGSVYGMQLSVELVTQI